MLAKTGEAAKSGPLGFAVILVLCVACYFLFKSMSRHLKRVREDFPAGSPAGTRTTPTAATAPTAAMRSAPSSRASDAGPGFVKPEPDRAEAPADGEH